MHTQAHEPAPNSPQEHQPTQHNAYRNLLLMIVLSFIAMYILMYAMVNTPDNVFNNLNQVYMAALMTTPMLVIELVVMRSMYPDKRRNMLIIAASVIAFFAFFAFIQKQTAIGDRQFLRSMIPHHAGAITMCEAAPLTDPQVKELCETIIAAQESEIAQMKSLLESLDR